MRGSRDVQSLWPVIGIGATAAGFTLAGVLYLLRTQVLEGAPVRVEHDLAPDTKKILRDFEPYLKEISEQGVQVKLFGKKAKPSPSARASRNLSNSEWSG